VVTDERWTCPHCGLITDRDIHSCLRLDTPFDFDYEEGTDGGDH